MVKPTNCPSPLVPQCTVETSEAAKCPNCAHYLLTIQKLECQLTEEKLEKENLAECLNNTFASLTKEIDNNDERDAKIIQLTAQLGETTAQLQALSNEKSTESLKRTMDEFQSEIMADKSALQMVLNKVNGVGATAKQNIKEEVSDQLEATAADNWALKSALETANSMISHLEKELRFANDRLKSLSDDTTSQDDTETREDYKNPFSSKVDCSAFSEPPVNDTQKHPIKNLKEKEKSVTEENGKSVKKLTTELLKAQRFITLVKKARGNANRILDWKFQHVSQQLHYFTHQSNQLVQELESVRRQLSNAEQEKAYLRNHLHYVMTEKEHLGILLANANRQAVENRESTETKNDEFQHLLKKVEKYAIKNEKLAEKNRHLQKLVEDIHGCHDAWENSSLLLDDSTPATPTTPDTPRTPTSPPSPYDEKPPMGQRKRRSDEHEEGKNKKQKQ
ncbi:unnamed protein product [Caenorhabditis brenneri]